MQRYAESPQVVHCRGGKLDPPVTRGARVAAFFWVQSLVRDEGRRRTLFELDQSIQALRASHADAAAVLQLTGVYHNLLREWSET